MTLAPSALNYWNDSARASCFCTPATCANAKCRATGKCIDQMDLPLPHPRQIIAFTGLAGSGKSTAAKHLCTRHGFERVRFAGPLKEMLRAFYSACGVSEKDAERRVEGDLKEQPDPLLCGRSPRYFMQRLGTEFGRDIIGDSFWVNAWRAAVDATPVSVPVVVDDCRFVNEANAIRAAGGVLISIERPGAGTQSNHPSEGQDLGHLAARVANTGTVADLLAKVDGVMRDLSWAH